MLEYFFSVAECHRQVSACRVICPAEPPMQGFAIASDGYENTKDKSRRFVFTRRDRVLFGDMPESDGAGAQGVVVEQHVGRE